MSKICKLWVGTVPVLLAAALLVVFTPKEMDINNWLNVANLIAVLLFVSLGVAMFFTAIALTVVRFVSPAAKILTSSKTIAEMIVVLTVILAVVCVSWHT